MIKRKVPGLRGASFRICLALCGPAFVLPTQNLLWSSWRPARPVGIRKAVSLQCRLGDELSLDRVGSLEFYQLRRGNRITGDDMLCAWVASRASDALGHPAKQLLELGAGCGSIGLMVLSKLPETHATLVERQEASFGLLRRNIAHNRLEDRVVAIHGDIRTVPACAASSFDLVVANPPYMPATIGALPAHAQKAFARFELRGGVEDFAERAGRSVIEGGQVVFVHSDAARTRAALKKAGLRVEHTVSVVLHRGEPPKRCVVLASRAAKADGRDSTATLSRLAQWATDFLPAEVTLHDASNVATREWRQICSEMGF